MRNNTWLLEYAALIENALDKYLPQSALCSPELRESMRYSLLGGGKRIRPILTLEFCRVCGGNIKDALPFACAVEMAHCYSLIHDDLPAMDDDDMRRGKPSNHIVFGEALAILAGDALLSLAFETILNGKNSPENTLKAAKELAKASGFTGMVAGQVIDIRSEGKRISSETLIEMHSKKTGAMIEVAARIGCISAGAPPELIESGALYAKYFGLCFQITDDILDVTGDSEVLGKRTGRDTVHEKATFVSILGLEEAEKEAVKAAQDAKNTLTCFPGSTQNLICLADMLLTRKN